LIQEQEALINKKMLNQLKQAIVKEKIVGEFSLATLEPDFYINLKLFMKTQEKPDQITVESMLNSLVRKRKGKLLHLANSSKLTKELESKITVEDKKFYNRIYNTGKEFTKEIVGGELI